MSFLIKTVTHQDLKDSEGRLIPTVICESLTEHDCEEMVAARRKAENEVLKLLKADPTISFPKIARAMNWKLFKGDPNKMKAKRHVDGLKHAKLVKQTRAGRWQLTREGEKAARDVHRLGCTSVGARLFAVTGHSHPPHPLPQGKLDPPLKTGGRVTGNY